MATRIDVPTDSWIAVSASNFIVQNRSQDWEIFLCPSPVMPLVSDKGETSFVVLPYQMFESPGIPQQWWARANNVNKTGLTEPMIVENL